MADKMYSEINRAYKTSIKCREEVVLLSLISFMEAENIWSLFAIVRVISVANYGLISKSTCFKVEQTTPITKAEKKSQ